MNTELIISLVGVLLLILIAVMIITVKTSTIDNWMSKLWRWLE